MKVLGQSIKGVSIYYYKFFLLIYTDNSGGEDMYKLQNLSSLKLNLKNLNKYKNARPFIPSKNIIKEGE